MNIKKAIQNNPDLSLIKFILIWAITTGGIFAFYIRKVNQQKKLEYAANKIQELENSNNEKSAKLEQYKEIVGTLVPQAQNTARPSAGLKKSKNVPTKRYQLPQIKITRRELSVIALIVDGKSNKEIADILKIKRGKGQKYNDQNTWQIEIAGSEASGGIGAGKRSDKKRLNKLSGLKLLRRMIDAERTFTYDDSSQIIY